ncbi:Serine/threonine kinase-like domain-containing protein STKLD1 [Trichoplax sp. H2]|nr:Serine/threonine kinase-like domain-containing protein STKLD1 [Trichoplax sp. H2]|eukprot:RDD44451.1 Serine/threonine kinase-like domain-containing protein STKLD1 [Trichoplax sp. H2]
MENYKLLQRLGKGAQGSVYLVEDKEEKKKYVLKKVECNDEGEANKAFKEAMALQELRHPYVCGYKEFFVTWDKEESAMFVCIVMEYYKMGDLDRVLKQKRQKNEYIEELILKKWIGQMIEALVFVHKKQVIHRDLKPSNIFMTEDLSISLGDFGVATVMDDARTRTRTTVGSMNWMAPEVLERPYDERSDVWSLGCIALEMATCGFLDAAQTAGILFQIKHSPQVLEEVLENVSKKYSADFCQLIRTMLRRNFQQRPTAADLVALPYVKDCLLLSGSALAARKKAEAKKEQADPVPKEQGIGPVLDYLDRNADSSKSSLEALKYIHNMLRNEDAMGLNDAGKRIIIKAMKNHIGNNEIQIVSAKIFSHLIVSAEENDIMYSSELIQPVTLAMRSHAGSAELQSVAGAVIAALSADENAAAVIGNSGGVQDILASLRAFPNDTTIISNCCSALWSLAANENNAKIVTEEKGLEDVYRALENHQDSVEVIESSCSALWSLSMEEENVDELSKSGTIAAVVNAIKNNEKEPRVVKSGCLLLASLTEVDESSAMQVINSNGVSGVPIIISAYKNNAKNAEVAENIFLLFSELAEYDEGIEEMGSLKVVDVLRQAAQDFGDNMHVLKVCNQALDKLQQ